MSRGGPRPNAGRKPNTPNKVNAIRQEAVAASGITPLDYMLSIMRNEDEDGARRLDAAKAVAPYVHPRLSQVDANVQGQFDLRAWMIAAQEGQDG